MTVNRRQWLGLVAAATVGGPWLEVSAAGSEEWAHFKKTFARRGILEDNYQNAVHTEALGVGMLFAQFFKDWAFFQRQWDFAQRLRRPDGLYSWQWKLKGKSLAGEVRDPNNASDGDLYMAWALAEAGFATGRQDWITAATQLSSALLRFCVRETPQGEVLIPGIEGFELRKEGLLVGHAVNPSYWVYPAFQTLAKLPGQAKWRDLERSAVALSRLVAWGPNGLPLDWAVVDASGVRPWDQRPARFGFEAVRVPLFLVWGGHARHPVVTACAHWMREPGFPGWVDLVDGSRAAFAAPAGFESVAAVLRRAQFGQKLPALSLHKDPDYYSASLTLLSRMALQVS